MSFIGSEQTKEPYVGIRPFTVDDSSLFFGRDQEAHNLADLWQANHLTILHGPRGVGKTSLLQGGVMPLLDQNMVEVLPPGRVSRRTPTPAAVLPRSGNPHVFALLSSWAPFTPPTQLS